MVQKATKLKAEDIIAALPSLPRQDRLAVRAACDLLLQGKGTKDAGVVALYERIAKGVGSSMPFGRCPANLQASLTSHEPGFREFINTQWPGLTRVQNVVVQRELLALLAGDLHQRGIPVTVATIIRNLGRLQDVFDTSYPGYRKSRLTKLVLNQWLK